MSAPTPAPKILTVRMDKIVVAPARGRKSFTRIQELADSLKTSGFINPILCTEHPTKEGHYTLIAGERRFRAAILAGFVEIPITFREGITDLQYKIMELEENTCRVDLDWQEESELHRQIDELKRQENPNWRQKDTAELVQLTPGHVSTQIAIAKKLKDNPELKEKIGKLPIRAAMQVIERTAQVERAVRLKANGNLVTTQELRLGDCRTLIKDLPDASVDLLLTDPPYGLEALEDMRGGSSDRMSGHSMLSEHHNQDIERVLKILKDIAPDLQRVLKPGAHFYVFTAFQYMGDFIKALEPLEFQPPCLIWHRGKPTTPGYGYNYLNSTEAIIYGHRAPRSKRLAENMYNILEHPEVPRNLRVYPTEKPQGLLKMMIKQSTVPGDTVLDLFAGSASTLKACRDLDRRGVGFEIDPNSWNRAQLALAGESLTEGENKLF